jgi:hypothetical protein
MTDGSTRRVQFVPATPTASSANFTVKSIGEVREAKFPFAGAWRRLQAEYRLNDDNTTVDLVEIGSIVSDPSPTADRSGYRELTQAAP